MKPKLILIFITYFTISFSGFAQTDGENTVKKMAISGNVLGTGAYLGFSVERLFIDRINLEVGLGLIGIGAGITYYPYQVISKSFRPYTGIKYTSHAIVDGPHKKVTYLPIGLTYFQQHISIGFDIGPAYRMHISPGYKPTVEEIEKYPFNDLGIFGNLKISLRF